METLPGWSGWDSGIVLAYLLGMLAAGWYAARRVRGFSDFFLAGGRLTTPILTCSLVSTYYGLDVTFGTSETAFHEGLAAFFSYSAPFYLAYAFTAWAVAPRLKRLPVRSLPEAMAWYYGDAARLAAAAASFCYSAPILAIAGMGYLGQVVLGWDPTLCAAIGAGLALAYTLMGGLLADALTDTVQFLIMCASVAVAVLLLRPETNYADLAATLDPALLRPTGRLDASELLVFLLIALTPLVEPAFYQRIFAGREIKVVRRALLLGLFLWMAYDWLVVQLGLAGRSMVASGRLPADIDSSLILVHAAAQALPAGWLGLLVAGCLAAAMSTIDSYTLIAAGNVVYDGVQPLRKRPLDDRRLVLWTRIGCVLTLAAALFLASRFARLRDAWIFMATLLMSTAFLPMTAALFVLRRRRPRAGSWSAWCGLVAAAGLFLAFETLGDFDPEQESRYLTVAGLRLFREHALLLTLPAAGLAFLAGYASDRRRAGESTDLP